MTNGRSKKADANPDPLEQLSRRRVTPAAPANPEPAAGPSSRSYDDLLAVAVSLTSTLDLTDILNHIVDGIMRVTGCERGFLMLSDGAGGMTAFTGRYRDRREWKETDVLAISRTIVERVEDTHEPFISSDLGQLDDLAATESIQANRIRAAVCLPLIYKDALTGVIYADSTFLLERGLDEDRSVLEAFSAQAALAIENGRRHGELLRGREQLAEQNVALRKQLQRDFALEGMVSRNKTMHDVFATVERLAPLDLTILINGESGTGKEVLAEAIHNKSTRADKPFLAVNCAVLPEGLVASILFGHRKGAFTGADMDRPGIFETASGGTLFLDEIGEMPMETQPKLLRVLEKRELSRMGEEGVLRAVDVRVLAATNVDLNAAVDAGRFRFDLLQRLRGAQVVLPPLRERREDIVPLAEHFLAEASRRLKIPTPQLSKDARALLMARPWEGNVRELRNATEFGLASQDERHVIHAGDIERYFNASSQNTPPDARSGGTLRQQAEQFEERVIRETLAENGHNVSRAAAALGISRQQLHTKIKKYGIETRPD
jgi:Nif-specific regulatory protein